MGFWNKKKVEEQNISVNCSEIFKPPPTPKHIIPIKSLTHYAESSFNAGEKEIEADTLKSLVNHINRYLEESTKEFE